MTEFTRRTTFVSLLVLLVVSGASILATGAEDDDGTTASKVRPAYRTMFRHEVDVLGGYEEGKVLRVNSTEALQAGLNRLAEQGWELVAVEGGRSVPVTGPHQGKLLYPPVYIFRNSKDH